MPRIFPITQPASNPKTAQLLLAVRDQMGAVPNIVATMANSHAALEAYLAMSGALNQGVIPDKLQEQIALCVAGANACDYCASAHTMVGGFLGVDKAEAERNLTGDATDDKTRTVLTFAKRLVAQRGIVSNAELQEVRNSGFSEGEIVEIVANVALNIFTNYLNDVAETEIDFPFVPSNTQERSGP